MKKDIFTLSEIVVTCMGRHRILSKDGEACLCFIDNFNNTLDLIEFEKSDITTSKTHVYRGIIEGSLDELNLIKAISFI